MDNIHVNEFKYDLNIFIMTAYRLEVETGRLDKPDITTCDERKCQLCSYMYLEDEFHFSLECPLYMYLEMRKTYIKIFIGNFQVWLNALILKNSNRKNSNQL